jgi:hypothetical protein
MFVAFNKIVNNESVLFLCNLHENLYWISNSFSLAVKLYVTNKESEIVRGSELTA